ncbi:MAG: hypothetical protein QMD02_02790 [Bacteroidales bacterium]|nr:hypothetical protein [Bacteroidales bacterium]
MKSKFLLFILIISILFLASGCKKKPTYYMLQEFKDYVMYPVGSYWVYEDSISGNIDSINLIDYKIYIFDPEHTCYCNYEKLEQNFYSSYNNHLHAQSWLDMDDPSFYEYSGYGYFTMRKTWNVEYIIKYDSLKILDEWYKNVYCIYTYAKNKIYYYWVKNIGVIKKENVDSSENWLLKSYHINN